MSETHVSNLFIMQFLVPLRCSATPAGQPLKGIKINQKAFLENTSRGIKRMVCRFVPTPPPKLFTAQVYEQPVGANGRVVEGKGREGKG